MSIQDTLVDLLDAVVAFSIGLVPGALGAAVSLAHEKGLTWSERVVQFAAGTVVSYFVQGAVAALYDLNPFILQSISFSAGLLAFKSTPQFIAAAANVVASLPTALRDRFIPTRKDKP